MREIKFRAWDEDKKEMISVYQILFGKTELKVRSRKDIDNRITRKNVIIQQSTGLKDKNGKDIYEGDICKAIRESDNKEIEFITGMAHAYVDWFQQPFEIIGNIFENQELISLDK